MFASVSTTTSKTVKQQYDEYQRRHSHQACHKHGDPSSCANSPGGSCVRHPGSVNQQSAVISANHSGSIQPAQLFPEQLMTSSQSPRGETDVAKSSRGGLSGICDPELRSHSSKAGCSAQHSRADPVLETDASNSPPECTAATLCGEYSSSCPNKENKQDSSLDANDQDPILNEVTGEVNAQYFAKSPYILSYQRTDVEDAFLVHRGPFVQYRFFVCMVAIWIMNLPEFFQAHLSDAPRDLKRHNTMLFAITFLAGIVEGFLLYHTRLMERNRKPRSNGDRRPSKSSISPLQQLGYQPQHSRRLVFLQKIRELCVSNTLFAITIHTGFVPDGGLECHYLLSYDDHQAETMCDFHFFQLIILVAVIPLVIDRPRFKYTWITCLMLSIMMCTRGHDRPFSFAIRLVIVIGCNTLWWVLKYFDEKGHRAQFESVLVTRAQTAFLKKKEAALKEFLLSITPKHIRPRLLEMTADSIPADVASNAIAMVVDVESTAQLTKLMMPQAAALQLGMLSARCAGVALAPVFPPPSVEFVHHIRSVGDMSIMVGGLFDARTPQVRDFVEFALYLKNVSVDLPVRAGIGLGPLLGLPLGSGSIRYDVFGPSLQSAQTMVAACPQKRVQLSETALKQLRTSPNPHEFVFEGHGSTVVDAQVMLFHTAPGMQLVPAMPMDADEEELLLMQQQEQADPEMEAAMAAAAAEMAAHHHGQTLVAAPMDPDEEALLMQQQEEADAEMEAAMAAAAAAKMAAAQEPAEGQKTERLSGDVLVHNDEDIKPVQPHSGQQHAAPGVHHSFPPCAVSGDHQFCPNEAESPAGGPLIVYQPAGTSPVTVTNQVVSSAEVVRGAHNDVVAVPAVQDPIPVENVIVEFSGFEDDHVQNVVDTNYRCHLTQMVKLNQRRGRQKNSNFVKGSSTTVVGSPTSANVLLSPTVHQPLITALEKGMSMRSSSRCALNQAEELRRLPTDFSEDRSNATVADVSAHNGVNLSDVNLTMENSCCGFHKTFKCPLAAIMQELHHRQYDWKPFAIVLTFCSVLMLLLFASTIVERRDNVNAPIGVSFALFLVASAMYGFSAVDVGRKRNIYRRATFVGLGGCYVGLAAASLTRPTFIGADVVYLSPIAYTVLLFGGLPLWQCIAFLTSYMVLSIVLSVAYNPLFTVGSLLEAIVVLIVSYFIGIYRDQQMKLLFRDDAIAALAMANVSEQHELHSAMMQGLIPPSLQFKISNESVKLFNMDTWNVDDGVVIHILFPQDCGTFSATELQLQGPSWMTTTPNSTFDAQRCEAYQFQPSTTSTHSNGVSTSASNPNLVLFCGSSESGGSSRNQEEGASLQQEVSCWDAVSLLQQQAVPPTTEQLRVFPQRWQEVIEQHTTAIEEAIKNTPHKTVELINICGGTVVLAGPVVPASFAANAKKLPKALEDTMAIVSHLLQHGNGLQFTIGVAAEQTIHVLRQTEFPAHDIFGVAVNTSRALAREAPSPMAVMPESLANFYKRECGTEVASTGSKTGGRSMTASSTTDDRSTTSNATSGGGSTDNTTSADGAPPLKTYPVELSAGESWRIRGVGTVRVNRITPGAGV